MESADGDDGRRKITVDYPQKKGQSNMNTVLTIILGILGSGTFCSLITLGLNRHWQQQDKKAAKSTAESRMLLGLGHDKILYLTDRIVKRGAITLKEKRNLEYLYVPYKEMGGNGDCKIGYDACQKLRIVSEDEADVLDWELRKKNGEAEL